jgi:5-methyltetrahydrofolate--homocysteine methyltransferase
MFRVMKCADIGMALTESWAMTPAASVSGFMLSHLDCQYFSVGKIGEDQLKDLAARRGETEEQLQRLLAPNL